VIFLKADLIIEGGGVKGIGLVGAIEYAEEKGYKWERLAGTSAGAIIAALLAAGFTARELKNEIFNFDFNQFIKKGYFDELFPIFDLFNLWRYYGIHKSDYIEKWMEEKLKTKGVYKFKDLSKKLYIIASDISQNKMLVLPDSLEEYKIDSENFSVAKAVQMSISIPYFFQPYKLINKKEKYYIVDGGLLSNFPVWLFDSNNKPSWPAFGVRTVSIKEIYNLPNSINNIISFSKSIINTMMEARDSYDLSTQNRIRTIDVPNLGIKATDFAISDEKKFQLYQAGRKASEKFFRKWSFEAYIKMFY